MSWTSPPQLVALAALYAEVQSTPHAIDDAALLAAVTRAHWPTNCWDYAQASLAIVAHACVLRPQLTRELIALPVAALVAGGLDSGAAVLAYGTACLEVAAPYVVLTPEGRRWIEQQWPRLGALVGEEVARQWQQLMDDDS